MEFIIIMFVIDFNCLIIAKYTNHLLSTVQHAIIYVIYVSSWTL